VSLEGHYCDLDNRDIDDVVWINQTATFGGYHSGRAKQLGAANAYYDMQEEEEVEDYHMCPAR
jgi:hypothetical protein